MKKSNFIFGLLALAGVAFTACETEVGQAPVIKLDNIANNTVTLAAGINTYTINGSVTSEEGLSFLKFNDVKSTGRTTLKTINKSDMQDNKNYTFKYEVTGITADVQIEVEAVDAENQTVTQVITIKYTSLATDPEITPYTAKLLGSFDASKGSFFATNGGTVYLQADAFANQAKVDFCYYYHSTGLATLAAMDDAQAATVFTHATYGISKYTTKNATRFAKLAGYNFAGATKTEVAALVAPTETKIAGLAKNDVLSFKTASGKKGLILVKNIVTGAAGEIEIDVKVQL